MQKFYLPSNLTEAQKIQLQLRDKVIPQDDFKTMEKVAGVDVGFEDNYKVAKAAVVVLSFPDLTLLESQTARVPNAFSYIPGFLSFREVPAILEAINQLKCPPDLIMCDGQGIAHPRRFGMACHLGLLLDCPTIGVAKSLLVGEHLALGTNKGDWQYLTIEGEIIGAVIRSRTNVKPLYVSLGHRISLATAIDYVFRCLTKYRLPETTRQADRLSKGSSRLRSTKQ